MNLKKDSQPQRIDDPFVSCLMPTYNRVRMVGGVISCPLVDEAVESFLRQTYTNSELVIINDTPGQQLKLAEPNKRIRIVNYNRRFRTLGDKCTLGLHTCRGHFVTRWDDDDISLPNRIAASVAIAKAMDKRVAIIAGYWWESSNGLECCEGMYGFNQDLYDLKLARRVRYRSQSNGEDQEFRADCVASAGQYGAGVYTPVPKDFQYIYRWAKTGSFHLSDSDPDTEQQYRFIGELPIVRTEYVIQPQWRRDYVADCAQALAALKTKIA